MAASDTDIAFSQVDGTLTAADGGANSLEMAFVQTDISATIEPAPYSEAMVRNKHAVGAPILRVTGDGKVSGSASVLVTSFKGSSTVTPYEVLTGTGLAASWTTTAKGDRKTIKLTFLITNGTSGAATQTLVFAYCCVTSIKVDPGGAAGLFLLSFDFVDHENNVTVS